MSINLSNIFIVLVGGGWKGSWVEGKGFLNYSKSSDCQNLGYYWLFMMEFIKIKT